jgi:hypothetical protein
MCTSGLWTVSSHYKHSAQSSNLIKEIQEMTEYQNSLTPYTAIMADIQHFKDKISKLERQVELLEDSLIIYCVQNSDDRCPVQKEDR